MTDNTPRPSADEIRALVERTRAVNRALCESGGRSWTLSIPVRETDPDVTIESLCAAVESLLEDRELLDGLERELKIAGSVDFVGVTPGTVRVYTFQRDYEGPTLRDALREAVGA